MDSRKFPVSREAISWPLVQMFIDENGGGPRRAATKAAPGEAGGGGNWSTANYQTSPIYRCPDENRRSIYHLL